MNQFNDNQKMHQFMGVELNIQTWNLLEKKDRDEKDDKRMIYFAKASYIIGDNLLIISQLMNKGGNG